MVPFRPFLLFWHFWLEIELLRSLEGSEMIKDLFWDRFSVPIKLVLYFLKVLALEGLGQYHLRLALGCSALR